MKKQLFLSTLLCILFSLYNFAQIDYGNVSIIRPGHQSTLPVFVKFKPNSEVPLQHDPSPCVMDIGEKKVITSSS